jgi:glycosyltransferase involved in cell wall biosynthesis
MGKRIAFIMPPLGDGGLDRMVLKLAELMSSDHEVDVVTVKAQGPFLKTICSDIRIIDLDACRALFSLPGLVKYLRRERPFALISAQYYVNVIAVWAKMLTRVPSKVIVTERLATSNDLSLSGSLKNKLLPLLMRHAYLKADEIIAVSRGAAEDLARLLGISSDRIKIIYNPTLDSSILDKANAPVEHPWFTDKQIPILISAGRLASQKDFSTLLRAFAEVRDKTEVRLVILGEGRDRNKLEELAEQLGIREAVALPGFVDNPCKYIAKADLFVLSSVYEGMPNALIEALAVGTAAIATDCPSGPREILPIDMLVPVGDHSAMAKKILDVLRDHEQQLRILRESRRNLDNFRAEVCLAKYMEVIKHNG